MIKRIIILTLSIVLVFTFFSCNSNDADNSDGFPILIYEDDEVKITQLEPFPTYRYFSPSWMEPTEKPIFDDCDAVFSGTVSNVKELKVEYEHMDHMVSEYPTIFDFTISEIFYQNDDSNLQVGDIAKMYHGYSTRDYPTGVAPIINGREYIIFSAATGMERNKLISDYVVNHPRALLLMKDHDGYDEKILEQAIWVLTHPINSPAALGVNAATINIDDSFDIEELLREKVKEHYEYKNK